MTDSALPPSRAKALISTTSRARHLGSGSNSTATSAASNSLLARVIRHRVESGAVALLLIATAALYLWDLSASGWSNSFYAAAAQAGSESWQAFFFGSSDAANSITVDKTPMSLWPMALAIRTFGLNSWSLLVPQALMGVASVALLYATVRRTTGSAGAAWLAGAVLALTPVATLMFRFDNPDALLVLLLIAAAWATTRAIESPRLGLRWMALAGMFVGFGYLTKMLQAFLVLPALGLAYLLFASAPLLRRLGHLVVAFVVLLVSAGWWVAIVSLWPADSRPYIGGSQTNSILELTLGYNGLGRLNGEETGSVGGFAGWGQPGLFRLFDIENGAQASWLLPTALMLGVAGLVWGSRRTRAALVIWLGSLLVTAATFSFMAGIFHAYYTIALAPQIGACIALGGHTLWQRRTELLPNLVLSLAVAASGVWGSVLLGRANWQPWLPWVVLAVGAGSALALLAVRVLPRRWGATVLVSGVAAALLGPGSYSIATAAVPHTGSIPTAGPSSVGGPGGFGGGGFGGFTGTPPGGTAPGGTAPGGTMPGGTMPGGTMPGGNGGRSSAGSLLGGSTVSDALAAELLTDADSYTWVAAAMGSNSASGFQLATQKPVMPIGGFNGSDPSPTLAQFQQYVADGAIHYFIEGGGGFGRQNGGSSSSAEIAAWVEQTFTADTVDGVTLYDLSEGIQ